MLWRGCTDGGVATERGAALRRAGQRPFRSRRAASAALWTGRSGAPAARPGLQRKSAGRAPTLAPRAAAHTHEFFGAMVNRPLPAGDHDPEATRHAGGPRAARRGEDAVLHVRADAQAHAEADAVAHDGSHDRPDGDADARADAEAHDADADAYADGYAHVGSDVETLSRPDIYAHVGADRRADRRTQLLAYVDAHDDAHDRADACDHERAHHCAGGGVWATRPVTTKAGDDGGLEGTGDTVGTGTTTYGPEGPEEGHLGATASRGRCRSNRRGGEEEGKLGEKRETWTLPGESE